MKRRTSNRNRSRSLSCLVRIALRRWETNEGWGAIAELHGRGSPQTLALVQALARYPSWRRRCLGLNIAAQLRRRRRPGPGDHALEATQALLLLGLQDAHPEVVCAAVAGLGHRPHPAALETLVKLASSPDDSLRWNVTVSLSRYAEPAAIDALLCLMTDPSDDVRDWATFGIGSMQSADTPAIRAALWNNVADPNTDVRGEALVGLAERRDARVIDVLLERLDPECRVYELDAAEKMADPRLLDALCALDSDLSSASVDSYWRNCLYAAIAACQKTQQEHRN